MRFKRTVNAFDLCRVLHGDTLRCGKAQQKA